MTLPITQEKVDLAVDFITHYADLCDGRPGWLSYHFGRWTPFGQCLLMALADCEARVPQLGFRFIKELHEVKYVPSRIDESAWKARFEELIQKFSEILVARAICLIEWPQGTKIEFEPLNKSNNKRPEFAVVTPEHTWLFEVKCPSFIAHQHSRSANEHQLPIRSFMREAPALQGETITLPRDNTLKDFLVSADGKFHGFAAGPVTGLLVVVWDASMYEAIGVLSHPQAGLLTPNSWFKKNGCVVTFPNVSGVIVLNRLEQLKLGAQEHLDELDPFELGGWDALPNTWCPNHDVGDLNPMIAKGFDAFHFEGTQIGADYSMMDYVLWLEAPHAIARRRARERRQRASKLGLKCGVSSLTLTSCARSLN